MANYIGTPGNDTLIGSAENDTMAGLAGDDYFRGGAGNDAIDGGAGDDRASYSDANGPVSVNLALGTASGTGVGDDTLVSIELVDGSSFDDILTGGNLASAGFEGFRGLAGNDTINGGGGFDRAYYDNSPAAVTVSLGGTGNGMASDGWGGTDTLININSVRGSAFNDTLTGSDSGIFEEFEGRAGNDVIDGKGGEDLVRYNSSPTAVTANLATGVAQDGWGGTDTLINIERLRGSNFNDTLTGNVGNNVIQGLAGNDSLQGGAGDDYLIGGAGDDMLDGGDGYDYAAYTDATGAVSVNLALGTASGAGMGTDTLISIELVDGSSFDDILTGGNLASAGFEGFRGLGGNDTINGGGGFDRAYYDNSPAAVTVLLGGTGVGTASDGWGGTDTLININSVRGSAFNDTLTGSDSGLFEDFEGRAGNDVIDGKGGEDLVRYNASPGAVTINLTTGVAQDGWGGNDTLLNIEQIRGSDFNDALTGDAKDNALEGLAGNDTLDGMSGTDTAVFSGNRANFTLAQSGENYVVTDRSGIDGTDTLINVERLQFSDTKLAIDLMPGSNAAKTVQFLGLLGFSFLSDKAVVGAVLGVFDQTSINLSGAFDMVLNNGLVNELAGGTSDTAFVKLIHRNLIGTEASDAIAATLATQLLKDSGGAFSRIELLNLGAGLNDNLQHVGLVGTTGLLATGLEYI